MYNMVLNYSAVLAYAAQCIECIEAVETVHAWWAEGLRTCVKDQLLVTWHWVYEPFVGTLKG